MYIGTYVLVYVIYRLNTLVRSGNYDKIGLIHLELVKFPLGISKPQRYLTKYEHKTGKIGKNNSHALEFLRPLLRVLCNVVVGPAELGARV